MPGERMNITLSADAELVRRSRAYASAHHTTLSQLVRDHLLRLTGGLTPEDAATEFARVARQHAGRSTATGRLDRDAIHRRQG